MYQRIAARFKDIILVIEIRDDEDGLGRTALRGWWGECLGRHRGGLLTQLQQDGFNLLISFQIKKKNLGTTLFLVWFQVTTYNIRLTDKFIN